MNKTRKIFIGIVSFIGIASIGGIGYVITKNINVIVVTVICSVAMLALTFVRDLYALFNKPKTQEPNTTSKDTPAKVEPIDVPEKASDDKMPPHNLPDKNHKFTGRIELLEEIHKALQTKNEVSLVQARAITGMGGIGKSETAKEYAYRYRQEYDTIWWVNAETSASMEEAFRSFAQRNRLGSPEDQSETVIANVRNWMNENRPWLFIFDNAENEKSLEKYSSASGTEGQHILVTSRNTQFSNYEKININVFSEAEACEFIKKYTEKPADGYFKELAKKMGYLPLALDQAGAFMAIDQEKECYREYLKLYEDQNLKLLTQYVDDPDRKTVATTWQISFDKISNEASKQLLNLCAFFAPDNIDKAWFERASNVLPDELREEVVDKYKYKLAIAELTRYSIVSLNKEGVLSIHRLVQEVIRDSLKKEQDRWRKYCVDVLNELRYFDFSTAESRTRFLILASHIESVTHGISEKDATEEVANLHLFSVRGYYELGAYDQALEYLMKDLAISEKVWGREHPDTAATYNNLGEVYRAQGKYDRALEYFMKALAIVEKVLGREHPDTATTYNNIAAVYHAQGKYDQALEYLMKNLAIREKVLGREHPDTATTYNNIAVVYANKGAYDQALEWYLKALPVLIKVLGFEHPNTKAGFNNMAAAYEKSGQSAPFEEWLEKKLSEL